MGTSDEEGYLLTNRICCLTVFFRIPFANFKKKMN